MQNPVTLDPKVIPKFTNELVIPPVYSPTNVTDPAGNVLAQKYTIDVSQFQQQILPVGFPATTVWGYGGLVTDPLTGNPIPFRNAPGATFEATRNIPVYVQWVNNLNSPHLLPVDPTLHWADPNGSGMPMPPFPPFPPGFPQAQSPVPMVPHLHGGEVPSASDGYPDAWFTAGEAKKGPEFVTSLYTYPNRQQPTTLWYHDHALGITRLNVTMGLAGFYLLKDTADPVAPSLPSGKYEVPIVIQDRIFDLNGEFFFPSTGLNPNVHPYWLPEFYGGVIMVNGKTWPNLNVEPTQYRFRLLNGSNARFYTLKLSNGQTFTQIGSDGGYLPNPVVLSKLTFSPGERADIIIDFSAIPVGTKLILENTAPAPFPKGTPADPQTVGQVMQFTLVAPVAPAPVLPPLPATLNTIPVLTPNAPVRTLTLVEVLGPGGPLEILLDGQKWHAPISELPKVGSTEEWQIVNLTADTHPMHLHLVQFQLVSRQAFATKKYMTDWMTLNGMPPLRQPTIVLPIQPYLQDTSTPPAANETGWKDTVQMNPGEVTVIKVRWATQDTVGVTPGVNTYPFDPTTGPGYVWHCHIIDHEDNEMMRPYKVTL